MISQAARIRIRRSYKAKASVAWSGRALLLLAMYLPLASTLLLLLSVGAYAKSSASRWINTWTGMPQLTEFNNLPNPPFNGTKNVFFNSTIRQTLHMSIGGSAIRVRFSNAFGVNNLLISAAMVALPAGGASGASQIIPSTIQPLTFSGSPSFSIPNAGLVVSDPLPFPIQAQQTIAVTLYLATGQDGFSITSHPGSRATTWMQLGNAVRAEDITGPAAASVAHWHDWGRYFVSAVETLTTSDAAALFIIGDSITDGRGSTTDGNDRWPDQLLARMQKTQQTRLIAVNNQAAGGNRVLADGLGPAALSRIDRDVLAQTARVKYAMLFEGVNDIGLAAPTDTAQAAVGDALIAAYKQISVRLRAAGIPLFAATITPFSGPFNDPNVTALQPYSNPIREKQRQRVNAFIRASDIFDAVVDFDKVVVDPSIPSQLAPQFDSGDFLHPNVAGYAAMAASFPLELFERFAEGV
ncbi:Extracellular GDSL-like lipase/acylhydrolase [Mycena kentingensis (nom. inval.)]|nr:Extracellular GDSL-like lipase/acylhydrolase [Mycena kentingensis (nom. inval.)]